MRRVGSFVTVLLVASACGGSSDTATPVTTVAPAATQASTTTVGPTTTVASTITVAPTTTEAPTTTLAPTTTTSVASTGTAAQTTTTLATKTAEAPTSGTSDTSLQSRGAPGSFATGLESAFQAAVDEEFAAARQRAGISVAVYTKDALWTYALGEASSTADMTADTFIPIGSTSKTFVAALILTQIHQGLYDAADSLEAVLSGHPDYGSFDKNKINSGISVEQMLSMRSGLPNFNNNRDGVRSLFQSAAWKPADNVNLAQDSFIEPGGFDYNDTNLVLLGLVAEFQGGQSLETLYSKTFFDPLGVSAVLPPHDALPSDMAYPYGELAPHGEGFGNLIDAAPYELEHYWKGQSRMRWPCCGLITTGKDLALWGYNLYSPHGSALPEAARHRLEQSLVSEPVMYQGILQNYGYMTTQRTYEFADGIRIVTVGHPGSGGGYSTLLRYSPELDLAVVVLANSSLSDSGTCSASPSHRDIRNCLAARIFLAFAKQ